MNSPATAGPRVDRTWLVAAAAATWGLDGLFRAPLSSRLAPATIVFWEHLVAVIVLAWAIPSAVRAWLRCPPLHKVAIAVIGIGASAGATALFTEAFVLAGQTGDYITPLLLQKLQPLFALLLAGVVLGERLRGSFALFAVPALVGAWLVSFPSPFDVTAAASSAALFAVAAALLWGAGTVLGRLVSGSIGSRDVTTMRYLWGLPAALVIAERTNAPLVPAAADIWPLIVLALVPGVLALAVYYYALRATPASRATLAELAFPTTAAFVGVAFLDSRLSWSQWLGIGIVVVAVLGLSWYERRSRGGTVAVEQLDLDAAVGAT